MPRTRLTSLLVSLFTQVALAQEIVLRQQTFTEPQAGATGIANVVVGLTEPSSSPVTFEFRLITETATVSEDVFPAIGTATIPAGATETRVPLTLRGDGAPEAHEFFLFTVRINNVEVARARMTIIDVDPMLFLVNTTDTRDDGACNGVHCSLNEAVRFANDRLGVVDLIHFDLGTGDVPFVIPHARLPLDIYDPVIIDGYTQPGALANDLAAGSNARLMIVVRGDSSPLSTHALKLTRGAKGSIIRGIAFGGFTRAIHFSDADGGAVEGCFIGTDATGTNALANETGIQIENSIDVVIGGATPAARNVVSGNVTGIVVRASSATRIEGNLVGTTASGHASLRNSDDGVRLEQAGGGMLLAGNVIAGNGGSGVEVGIAGGTIIRGNAIGQSFDGAAIPNGVSGLRLSGPGVTVTQNIIATNVGAGVTITGSSSDAGHRLSANTIRDNAGLAIDLTDATGSPGVTINDAGDFDSGANGLQNFPTFTRATALGAFTAIAGTLQSRPNATYTIELFENERCDTSGHGEAEHPLTTLSVTTDASGLASFARHLPLTVTPGRILTATATDAGGSTSELSPCIVVAAQGGTIRRRSAK